MNKLLIAYFGSPDFSADFLEKLITDVSINQLIDTKLIVTQPDMPVGRKQILTPTPVKKVAEKYKGSEDTKFFAVFCFPSKNFGIELTNIDLALVYAFGEIIPKEILSLPKYGFWNIHPSLLPKYRGSSPIASPIIAGDKTTGVTIIKMDEQIDHGPIIVQQSLIIEKTDKRPDLEFKLTSLAFEMFKKTVVQLTSLRVNELKTKEQNHNLATYTKRLKKADGFISIENLKLFRNSKLEIRNSPEVLYNLFRGLYPWPGIWTLLSNGKRLKITDMKLYNFKNFITLKLLSVQLEGKKEVDFETFNKAYKIF